MQRTALLRALLLLQAPVILMTSLPEAGAQTCNKTITGTIDDADSTSPDPEGGRVGWRIVDPANDPETCVFPYLCDPDAGGGWGSVSFDLAYPGTYEFRGSDGDYLPTPWGQGGATCSDVSGCLECSGGFDIVLHAKMGNFFGHVYRMPSALPVADALVLGNSSPPYPQTRTDSDGEYDFSGGNPNNWGVLVFGNGMGPGSATYDLSADFYETRTRATTQSSKDVEVDLVIWSGGHEKPSRCEPPSSNFGPGGGEASTTSSTLPPPELPICPSCEVGRPVSVTTGAVYFDQTDVTIPGLGPGLRFVRSYNSQLRQPSQYGAFGRGWNFTYEQRLSFPSAGVIMLRKANGNPTYFQDNDADLTFEASVPFTKASWIVKQPDGTYIRNFRNSGEERYDASGRLTSLVDVANNTTTLAYDGSGRLITITEASGRALTLAYPNGEEITLSGPSGLIATYHLDSSSRLDRVTYPDLSGYRFTYDANHQLETVIDHEEKPIETHLYDGTRAMTSEIADGQERLTFSYDSEVQTTVTDARGNATIYEFSSIWGVKLVTKVTGVCGSCGSGNETQEWTYDNRGKVTSYKDGSGKLTTYEYVPYFPPSADSGDLLRIIDHPSQGPITRYTYAYDSSGRLLSKADAGGGEISYTYLTPAGPDKIKEKVLGPPDETFRTTIIDYMPFGKPWHITDPRGKTMTFGYDVGSNNGDLRLVTDPVGNPTAFGYDAMGRRITVTDPLNHTTTITYDGHGRVQSVKEPDALQATVFGYDLGGRRKSVTDPLGRVTGYEYDPYGRLWHVTDALNKQTTYLYDLMGNLEFLTDSRNNTTTFAYDDFNRVETVTYPDTRYESFTYDAAGRIMTRTDRKNVKTTYTYDDLGRLESKSYNDVPPTPTVTFGYDAVGRLTSASSATDNLGWTYDLVGQALTAMSTTNNATLEYEYDLGGNRKTVKLDGGLFTTSEYDDASRLTSITRGASTYGFQYYADSRRRLLTFPNNVTTDYTYDTRGRLTDIHYRLAGQTVTQTTYPLYDEAGNRKEKGGDFLEDYAYDELYRLRQVKRGPTITESYTYDDVGNRRSSLQHPNWVYPTNSNRLESYNGTTFGYDPNGNLESKNEPGNAWVYHWNAENQLRSVDRNGTEVARFTYDPLGRRIQKVVGTVTHMWLYDGEDILREIDGGSTFKFVHGPGIDEPLSRETDVNPTIYAHVDGLGSLVKATGGQSTFTRKYDAFGNMEQGAAAASYAFTGREWDPETGLYYYRARYYDPKIGRFISEDPIRFDALDGAALNGLPDPESHFAQSDFDNPDFDPIVPSNIREIETANAYPYAVNNPATLGDPTGESAWRLVWTGGRMAWRGAVKAWQVAKPPVVKAKDYCFAQAKRVRCRWEPHDKPNHYFFGRKMCHMQLDCWIDGRKGSDVSIRIPRPWCHHTP